MFRNRYFLIESDVKSMSIMWKIQSIKQIGETFIPYEFLNSTYKRMQILLVCLNYFLRYFGTHMSYMIISTVTVSKFSTNFSPFKWQSS